MQPNLDPGEGLELTMLAREAIERWFKGHRHPQEIECPAFLNRRGATFVTLTQGGELRGCIGTLEAYRPVGWDVQANALAAAFSDPRFPPLRREELDRTDIEVSVLSRPRPLAFKNRDDLLRKLRPSGHGVILEAEGHRGTFLPQVWEQLPTPDEFLSHLVRKAGLPADYWSDDVRIWRYAVTTFEEERDNGANLGEAAMVAEGGTVP
ncbi:MAG: AmmeMemoRadiSam system protein A [Bifidobacteriaceae bacterium]|jgi:AmmeMemoRadiSam system protein A|nr:AmmeMemoRadiSam system protein A [Bifidobacteriaceae bacterium]